MQPAILVEDLRKTYHGSTGPVHALDGVSFEVPQGKIFGLLGPNGAGKSTLVKVLTTITAPSSGRALVRGFDAATQSLDVRKQISVVLQQTAVETLLTVEDNLLIYAYLHGMPRAEAKKRMLAVAEEFELAKRLKETVYELSIGTKRRIQVAKVFMLDSPVIFLDEATTGMDPLMKRRVMDRLKDEARKGRAVLLTTQILSEAEELCDNILIIDKGRKLAGGTLQDLRALSEQMFHVTLSFTAPEEAWLPRLRALQPVELEVEDKTVRLLFRGEQASLLQNLADVAKASPLSQFEVRGADLEEIFVTLLKDGK